MAHTVGQARKTWSSSVIARALPIRSALVRAHLLDGPAHLSPHSLSIEDSNAWIARAISSGNPVLISRFGSVELDSMMLWERISKWG